MTAPQREQREQRAPRTRRATVVGEGRAVLRLVLPDELSPATRRRRARLLLAGVWLVSAVALLGVVAAHVLLAQQAFRMDRLQSKATTEQARNQALRLQVAELEAPSRIVAEAQQRLGMVTPPTVAYLVPGRSGPPVRSQPAPSPTTTVAGRGGYPPRPGSSTTSSNSAAGSSKP